MWTHHFDREMGGKIIAVEGADSSGKSTQAKLLARRLEAEGYRVRTMDFPQYDSFFGRHVGKFLRGEYGTLDQVHPEVASLLFAFDRYGAAKTLRQWLDEGFIVVMNRYMESNMAHQGAKIAGEQERKDFLAWLYRLEVEQLEIPQSDLVLYLHVPTDISQRILGGRENKSYLKGKERDINEADVDYQRRSVSTYLELCGVHPHWRRIECASGGELLSVEEIHELVWSAVKREL